MGLIVSILIIAGVVWAVKQTSEESEDSKANLLRQIKQVQKRVNTLEAEVRLLKGIQEPLSSQSRQEQQPDVFEELLVREQVDNSEPEQVEEENQQPIIEEPAFKKNGLESYLTSDLFNKIGAVALILGMGFFLKYAFDTSLFNPVVQILLSFLFSGGLISGASHFYKQEKYKIFAQGLAGAGIGISYLTIYSAYSSYQLFNYPIACIFMLITTIVAFYQSLKYDSIATAIIALIGGFLTPFIISSGNANSLGLLTYLIFLNGLIVALLHRKDSWKIIGIISLFITYLTYFSVHMSSYNPPNESGSIVFLAIVWAMYFGFDVLTIKASTYDFDFLNIENGILFYLGVYNLYSQNTSSVVVSTFIIALIYLFSGIAVYYKHDKLDIYLKQNFIAFAILFAIATNLATAGFLKPALFSIEAFLLLYFGTQLEKSYVQKASATFFTMSYLTLLSNPQVYSPASIDNFIPIFNFRDLTFALIIGLTLLSVKILQNEEKVEGLISFFRCSWVTLLFVFLSVEINDLMLKISSYTSSQETGELINFNRGMIQVIVWLLYSTKLLSTGMGKNIKPFTVLGSIGTTIAIIALFAQGTTYCPIERYIPIFNLRFMTFVIGAMNLMYISKLLKKHNRNEEIQNFLTYACGIILFLLVNFEINDYFIKFNQGVLDMSGTKNLALSAGWLAYSILAMCFGILKRIKPLRYISLVVLCLTILKVFILDLSHLDQLSKIISFLGLGAILLLLSFLYQKYSEQIKKLINEDITK